MAEKLNYTGHYFNNYIFNHFIFLTTLADIFIVHLTQEQITGQWANKNKVLYSSVRHYVLEPCKSCFKEV